MHHRVGLVGKGKQQLSSVLIHERRKKEREKAEAQWRQQGGSTAQDYYGMGWLLYCPLWIITWVKRWTVAWWQLVFWIFFILSSGSETHVSLALFLSLGFSLLRLYHWPRSVNIWMYELNRPYACACALWVPLIKEGTLLLFLHPVSFSFHQRWLLHPWWLLSSWTTRTPEEIPHLPRPYCCDGPPQAVLQVYWCWACSPESHQPAGIRVMPCYLHVLPQAVLGCEQTSSPMWKQRMALRWLGMSSPPNQRFLSSETHQRFSVCHDYRCRGRGR